MVLQKYEIWTARTFRIIAETARVADIFPYARCMERRTESHFTTLRSQQQHEYSEESRWCRPPRNPPTWRVHGGKRAHHGVKETYIVLHLVRAGFTPNGAPVQQNCMNTPSPDCLHPTRTVVIMDILLRTCAAMHITIAAAAWNNFCAFVGAPFLWGPLFVRTCWTCLNPPLCLVLRGFIWLYYY